MRVYTNTKHYNNMNNLYPDYRPATGIVDHESYLILTLQTLSDDIAVETNDRVILEFTSSIAPNFVELVEATGEYISHRAEVFITNEDS